MIAPLQIGITGGIGSGKSLVCKIFQCLGVPVYDADLQARKLMASDETLIEAIRKEFGVEAYRADGTLDRQYLAQHVFGAGEKVVKLNHLVHPRVKMDYRRWAMLQTEAYCIKEAALLLEARIPGELDAVIVVSAPVSLRLQRVLHRDPQRTEKDILNIMSLQLPEEEKIRLSDFVIVNDESRLVIPQVLELHKQFTEKA